MGEAVTRITGSADNRLGRHYGGSKWIGPVTQDNSSLYKDLSRTRHVERIESRDYVGTVRQNEEGRYIIKITDNTDNPVFKAKTYTPEIYWLSAAGGNPDAIGFEPFWKHTDIVHSTHNKSPYLKDLIQNKTVQTIASSLFRALKDEKQTECLSPDEFWAKIRNDKSLIAIQLI